MMTPVTITPGMPPRPQQAPPARRRPMVANLALLGGVVAGFGLVAGQLMFLGLKSGPQIAMAVTEPSATSFARPDLIDRNGRLIATDVEAPSLFADPALVQDRDEVVEKLATVLSDLDQADLRRSLSDKARRFVWIRRGLSPRVAQRVHDLGLPGISFRKELRRAYPAGELAGHIIGSVNVDNKGTSGIEKYVDDVIGVEPVHSATLSDRAPVRLSIDLGVQHTLEDELETALRRYHTEGAAGLIMDVTTGEIVASASLPRVDPSRPAMALDPNNLNRVTDGTYELGSVMKTMTIAMALDAGTATADTILDVRQPLTAGRFTITDLHPAGRALTVAEVFTHSSNVGAGMLALEAGADKVTAFFKRAGLLEPIKTEAGPVKAPQLPSQWERAELITVSYGHGIALSPLQFAAAAAALVNGGKRVAPTYLKYRLETSAKRETVVSPTTSLEMARLMRLNVLDGEGTGKRADVPGYRVGGKTGTAELADNGGYQKKAVLSSFLGTFPADEPRYVTMVLLFEPEASVETGGQRTASTNAAPVTARLIRRIAPQLGVAPLQTALSQ